MSRLESQHGPHVSHVISSEHVSSSDHVSSHVTHLVSPPPPPPPPENYVFANKKKYWQVSNTPPPSPPPIRARRFSGATRNEGSILLSQARADLGSRSDLIASAGMADRVKKPRSGSAGASSLERPDRIEAARVDMVRWSPKPSDRIGDRLSDGTGDPPSRAASSSFVLSQPRHLTEAGGVTLIRTERGESAPPLPRKDDTSKIMFQVDRGARDESSRISFQAEPRASKDAEAARARRDSTRDSKTPPLGVLIPRSASSSKDGSRIAFVDPSKPDPPLDDHTQPQQHSPRGGSRLSSIFQQKKKETKGYKKLPRLKKQNTLSQLLQKFSSTASTPSSSSSSPGPSRMLTGSDEEISSLFASMCQVVRDLEHKHAGFSKDDPPQGLFRPSMNNFLHHFLSIPGTLKVDWASVLETQRMNVYLEQLLEQPRVFLWLALLSDFVQNITDEVDPSLASATQLHNHIASSLPKSSQVDLIGPRRSSVSKAHSITDYDAITKFFSLVRRNRMTDVKTSLQSISVRVINVKTGETALHVAAIEGHMEMVKFLIKRGADIYASDNNGRTALHCAIIFSHLSLATLLLRSGCDVSCSQGMDSLLHYAVKADETHTDQYLQLLRLLVDVGVNINHQNGHHETPLHHAVFFNKMTGALFLLENGANIDVYSRSGFTCLHLALLNKNESMAATMLHYGASCVASSPVGSPLDIALDRGLPRIARIIKDVSEGRNIAYQSGERDALVGEMADAQPKVLAFSRAKMTPVQHDAMLTALERDNVPMLRKLISEGMDVRAVWGAQGTPPLHYAASLGALECLRVILKMKTELNSADASGNTALHMALERGHLQAALFLIRKHANVNAANHQYSRPLHCAVRATAEKENPQLFVEVLSALFEAGAMVNCQNSIGESPLYVACLNDKPLAVLFLLRRGADPSIRANNGMTPIHVACMYGHYEVACVLLQHGANPGLRSCEGTCVEIAEKGNQREIVKLLLGMEDDPYTCTNDVHQVYQQCMAKKKELVGPHMNVSADHQNVSDDIFSDSIIDKDPFTIFTVERELGAGACGQVVAALHPQSKFRVAIKTMRVRQQEKEAIQREISILSKCRHPNIVQYYGSYFHQTAFNISILMEFCSVGDILALKNGLGRQFQEIELACMLDSILHGLSYLHDLHIIHRDLKAQNILVTSRGVPKIADFGVAGTIEKENALKTIIGTPLFMSPEVLSGSSYDTSTDIWSLGITVIQMVDGAPPHENENPMRAMMKLVNEAAPTVRRPSMWGATFLSFLNSCLQKNPKERPSASQLREHPLFDMTSLKCADVLARMMAEYNRTNKLEEENENDDHLQASTSSLLPIEKSTREDSKKEVDETSSKRMSESCSEERRRSLSADSKLQKSQQDLSVSSGPTPVSERPAPDTISGGGGTSAAPSLTSSVASQSGFSVSGPLNPAAVCDVMLSMSLQNMPRTTQQQRFTRTKSCVHSPRVDVTHPSSKVLALSKLRLFPANDQRSSRGSPPASPHDRSLLVARRLTFNAAQLHRALEASRLGADHMSFLRDHCGRIERLNKEIEWLLLIMQERHLAPTHSQSESIGTPNVSSLPSHEALSSDASIAHYSSIPNVVHALSDGGDRGLSASTSLPGVVQIFRGGSAAVFTGSAPGGSDVTIGISSQGERPLVDSDQTSTSGSREGSHRGSLIDKPGICVDVAHHYLNHTEAGRLATSFKRLGSGGGGEDKRNTK